MYHNIAGAKHPEEDHHADCRPVPQEKAEVLEIDRTMRSEIRTTGKRPREAYTESVSSISKRFKSSEKQAAVISSFPTFPEIRRQLYRHRDATHIPVPDPFDLPDELRTTIRGKSVDTSDINSNERFLLYTGQDGRLQIFAADTELHTLYNSEYVICDGTFEMTPNSSYQLYTMHAFVGDEGMPVVWAILPNKSKATYIEMFSAVERSLVEKNGNVGRQRCFLVDFELAAIDAIGSVFRDSRVKGCTFHFRQALMRRAADEGLRVAYVSQSPREVRDWIREIMAMTLLPVVFIPHAWEYLQNPPLVEDDGLNTKMRSFSDYFQRTWITGSFSPRLWSHFDNNGPRTTNLAEGWHNQLNHSFGMPHPSSRNFLHWLQKCQFEVQCREIQLAAGRAPKTRSRTYVQLDARIADAKLNLSLRCGNIFVFNFPHPSTWDMLRAELASYLRYVCYLIAGQE